MSNDKANAAYHGRTERPTFPEDALTADDRRGWNRSNAAEWAAPKPARGHTATVTRIDTGDRVEPTLANFGAMLIGGLTLAVLVAGIVVELALFL